MEDMKLPKRSRKFSCVTYLTETDLVACLNKHQQSIRGFAYAYHDKDVTEEGKLKEKHAHLVLWLYNASNKDNIRRWFVGGLDEKGQPANTLSQVCIDVFGAYEYLWHKNNEEKYQYDPSIVVSSDPALFEQVDDFPDTDAYAPLEDMLNGVPLSVVAKRYGRDFIVHYGHYRQIYEDIKSAESV